MYVVINESCCEEHGETEIDYYDTLEEAEKHAYAGNIICEVIREVK
jgi:hypothetical protein